MPTALTTAIVGASDRCLVGGHLQVAFRVPAASLTTTVWVLFCLGLLTFMLTTVARYTACCLRGTQVKGLRLGSHLHCWTSEYCFSYQVTQASSAQWGDRRGPGLPHVRQFIYCRLGTLNAVQAE